MLRLGQAKLGPAPATALSCAYIIWLYFEWQRQMTRAKWANHGKPWEAPEKTTKTDYNLHVHFIVDLWISEFRDSSAHVAHAP